MVRTRFYGGFGVLVLALWNYAPPVGDTASYTVGKPKGEMRHFEVDLSSLPAGAAARVWRLDETHGNAVVAFDRMGARPSPRASRLRNCAPPAGWPPPSRWRCTVASSVSTSSRRCWW